MDPTDQIAIGNQRLERYDDNREKTSGSSDEEGSAGRPRSNSDHSDISDKDHLGPSSDEDNDVRNESHSGRSCEDAPANRDEGRKKHRRKQKAGRHHRRFPKPYDRGYEERRRMLLRAPNNTTQYIMDDHPDSNSSPGTNANPPEETYRRGLNDFKRDYLDSTKEELKQLTKPELIRKVMELESKSLLFPVDLDNPALDDRLKEYMAKVQNND